MGDAVFSVQAIMTLQDLISGKLAGISRSLAATGREAQGLGAKLGALAKSMLPVVAVAAALMLGLGGAVAKAADFQQAMSHVAAVASASSAEMAALKSNALEMGAKTAYSAMEAAGAQEDLAKAGLEANQIIAAMPGVLSMAAAGDIGLSQAAEAATDTMKTFHMEAGQIGFIGDVMAATANKTSTDVGLMVQSLKNCSAVAASVGVDLTDLSAMIGKMADQGVKGAEAGTQLRDMMLRLAAPNKKGAELLGELGIKTRDAKGNILPILDVMEQLEGKLKGMGTGTRATYIKEIFGDYAITATNALLNTGIDKVRQFAGELRNSAGSAAETAAKKMDNLKGSLKSLHGSWDTLLISIGDPFLKPLKKVADALIPVLNLLSDLAQTDVGQALVLLAGGAATVVVASAAVAAGLWAMSMAGAAATWALAPLGAALAALGAPIWAVLAVIAVLVVAWKTNFGGMRTTLTEWWNKAVLVCRGVAAVFGSLTGSTGELRGQLAKDIEAKGLLGVVTKVGKVLYRLRQFFASSWDALRDGVSGIGAIFAPLANAFDPILNALAPLWAELKQLFGIAADSKLSGWAAAGKIFGQVLGVAFRLIALGIRMALVPLQLFGALIGWVIGVFTGKGGSLADLGAHLGKVFTSLWQSVEAAFPGITAALEKLWTLFEMWCVGLGVKLLGWLRDAFSGAGEAITGALSGVGAALSGWWDGLAAWFAGLNPVAWVTGAFAGVGEAIMAGFEQVKSFLAGIDLSAAGAAIMHTLTAGVKSAGGAVAGAVKSAFNAVTPFLTHSDAKEGPLSTLTASGRAIMTTLATGVASAGPRLAQATSAAMVGAALTLANPIPAPAMQPMAITAPDSPALPDLTATASWQAVPPPDVRLPDAAASGQSPFAGGRHDQDRPGGSRIVIQSLTVTLPDVTDGQGFAKSLQRFVEQYDA